MPTIIISPYDKRGFVDHTLHDTTSILATLDVRLGLARLRERNAAALDLRAAFDFDQMAGG